MGVTNHDDRLATNLGSREITRFGYLGVMPNKHPGFVEEMRHLKVKQLGIHIDVAMHSVFAHQVGNGSWILYVGPAHGLAIDTTLKVLHLSYISREISTIF